MPNFAEEIQSLCDSVFAAKRGRQTAVAELKVQTKELMDENERSIQSVRDEQREQAAEDKAALAANCRDRSEQVQAFREATRDKLQSVAEDLREKLESNQHERQEAVSEMLKSFNEVQVDFRTQCQTATRLWREMRQRG
jgi:ABC-type multidrug transport system ATPase subunit